MQENPRIIEVKRSIFENNDKDADRLRAELKEKKTFLLNLMSSPGSGKTTTLLALHEALKGKVSMGVVRTTFLIDEAGNISKIMPKVKPDTNASDILAEL